MISSQLYPVEFLDETLDINATENYDLTVEVSGEGITIAILDLLRGKYVMLRNYHRSDADGSLFRSLKEITENDDFLRKQYRKTIIITPSFESTLVPSPLFDPELKDDYLRYNISSSERSVVSANQLPFPGATILFSPPQIIGEIISEKWPGVIPWNHTKPLLHHAFTVCRSSEERYLHLHIEKDFITIIIIAGRKLLFCNNFKTSAPADVSYYLFNVFDKHGIKNSETLHISGSIEPYGEMHLSILNYAETVRFAEPAIRYNFSYVMNEVPKHRWLNLFTAATCE